MRKTHSTMVEAFWGGYGKKKANDAVVRRPIQQMEWNYHGHMIAWGNLSNEDDLNVSFCGYGTYSTKARLNALMDKFGYQRFYQKDFQIYYGLIPIDVSKSYNIKLLDEYNSHIKELDEDNIDMREFVNSIIESLDKYNSHIGEDQCEQGELEVA